MHEHPVRTSREGTELDTRDHTLCDSVCRQVQNSVLCGDRKSASSRPAGAGRAGWEPEDAGFFETDRGNVAHIDEYTKTLELYALNGHVIW